MITTKAIRLEMIRAQVSEPFKSQSPSCQRSFNAGEEGNLAKSCKYRLLRNRRERRLRQRCNVPGYGAFHRKAPERHTFVLEITGQAGTDKVAKHLSR